MKGTEKQVAYANDIIKEWREHAAQKKAFFESKKPNEMGMKLLYRAMEILEERISAKDNAGEIITSRYAKEFDYEQIFESLCKGEIR